jgi:iron(III) transport system ATP-binding protein
VLPAPAVAAESEEAALGLEEISHSYGALPAVSAFSLGVSAGELVCLIGPSGCGKTTVLRLAAGLEPLQRGRITIGGQIVAAAAASLPPEVRGVGLLFQDFALFPHLSVRDNVGFGLRRLAATERRRRIAEALEQVQLADYANAYPHMLSGGQQQRVALARALAPAPKVLLLDEPFSGLDSRASDRLLALIDELAIVGRTILIATHDLDQARAWDLVLCLNRRQVAFGHPSETLTREVLEATYGGAIVEIPGEGGGLGVLPPHHHDHDHTHDA